MNGLSIELINRISDFKNEPDWMREYRLKAYKHYIDRPVPKWGVDLSGFKEDEINFFVEPGSAKKSKWEDVPKEMLDTFEKLKIPEAERKFLAGVETQFDSNVVYGRVKEKWESKGVIFTDTDTGLKEYPEIFKKWFGKVIPYNDNKYAALNAACWSGGSFVYVPKGVKVDIPLQAYFYIKTKNLGQFERTIIIADEGAEVQYVEGCSAPTYSSSILHSGVIELIALKNARIRYTTVQNWSKNVYNLVTQRGLSMENSIIEWVDCNLGSRATMKYPSVILAGRKAHGEVLSVSVADKDQHQDTGAKMIHKAPDTSSVITTKSICKNGGRVSYRGLVKIEKGAKRAKSRIECDSLIMDNSSQTDTYPYNEIDTNDSYVEHEASVSKVSDSQLYYLTSRGLTEEEARGLIVAGFVEPIAKELPMEYAMEMNDLIRMSMEGSVG
ncbi:MAG: Fe-S cluster assembly protein SufB [Candidatus Dojkabacteria bacterium]|nr:Fe-S cluster assembly protein SufB [Candidatus Dojkabacteria bacterium]MDQ7020548.1 Fe-S cluster assembly protein SufB [Candidatus Dojkabacteria bacterium]